MTRILCHFSCVLLVTWTAVGAAAEKKPNVVVILTDDQGALDARCYGSTDLDTPAIDRLAQEGIRFTQAYAHTVCTPARAMLMSGRYPQRSDVNTWRPGMNPREVTLAETLQKAGYRTGLFGKWHLGKASPRLPSDQGFDRFFGIRQGFIDNYVHFSLHGRGAHDLYDGKTEIFRRGKYFPDLITERAIDFIEKNKDRPFFMYYALNIPHYPEQSLAKYQKRYHDLAEPRRSYAAIVSTTDEYIGRIVAKLESLGLLDDTIVVYTSDNGYSAEDYQIKIDNHRSGYPKGHNYGANGGGGKPGPWIGAKGSMLEGGIRVPAVLRYPPKVPKGAVRDQAVTLMDWYPTILDLCGIEPPEGVKFDGHSVMPVVKDAAAPGSYDVMHWQWQKTWMVRDGNWKLIVNGSKGLCRPRLDRVHLGNLADEHPETVNHAKEHPEIVKRLRKLHEAWFEEVMPKKPAMSPKK